MLLHSCCPYHISLGAACIAATDTGNLDCIVSGRRRGGGGATAAAAATTTARNILVFDTEQGRHRAGLVPLRCELSPGNRIANRRIGPGRISGPAHHRHGSGLRGSLCRQHFVDSGADVGGVCPGVPGPLHHGIGRQTDRCHECLEQRQSLGNPCGGLEQSVAGRLSHSGRGDSLHPARGAPRHVRPPNDPNQAGGVQGHDRIHPELRLGVCPSGLVGGPGLLPHAERHRGKRRIARILDRYGSRNHFVLFFLHVWCRGRKHFDVGSAASLWFDIVDRLGNVCVYNLGSKFWTVKD
mmetsp:Transcript_22021/g.61279  ORF Transcript_22021/g.61279 Transcript_22021/m.61279 type:complete len:296 (+) Transcript_22021:612-1499(+)